MCTSNSDLFSLIENHILNRNNLHISNAKYHYVHSALEDFLQDENHDNISHKNKFVTASDVKFPEEIKDRLNVLDDVKWKVI